MIEETIKHISRWTIHRYYNDKDYVDNIPYSVTEFEGNLLLNEGIIELLKLLIGATADAYNNATAYLGVGDSSTAAAATQTDLQAVTNKKYVAMDATYPSRTTQTVTWRATYTSANGNFAWAEFTLANASSGSGDNLNRKVSDQGTKVVGQTWVLSLTLTIS